MLTDGIERELLVEICNRFVVNKQELIGFLDGKVEKPAKVADTLTKSLMDKELIRYVEGQGCYAITQKGMRELRE